MAIEREYKFLLSKTLYERLLAEFAWHVAVVQENIFFDTAERRLLNSTWALRLRFEADVPLESVAPPSTSVKELSGHWKWTRSELTAKGPATRSGALFERPEHECALPVDFAESLRAGGWKAEELPESVPKRLLCDLGLASLEMNPLASFRNLRYLGNLDTQRPPARAELVLDFSLAPDGRQRFELEIVSDYWRVAGDHQHMFSDRQAPEVTDHRLSRILGTGKAAPTPSDKFAWLLKL